MKTRLWFLLTCTMFGRASATLLCPAECHCSMSGASFVASCVGQGLVDAPDFADISVDFLDLSDNNIATIPSKLSAIVGLQIINLSGNGISKLPADALAGFDSLIHLRLSRNNISNWIDINPNEILRAAPNLQTLSLSANPLTSFSSTDDVLLLSSSSLRMLDLSECRITKVQGSNVLQGLPKLEHLILNTNPIRSVSDMVSDSLITLSIDNAKLTGLQPTVFTYLPALSYVSLARNHRLSLVNRAGDFVYSESVRRIDLSYCNMDNVELDGFPHVVTAVLRGNLIRQLTRNTFAANLQMENLDLSQNAIGHVSANALHQLAALKQLDLSFNMIPRIERDTFKDNDHLVGVNLSRNYIVRFSRIVARSVAHLNMSACEILTVDPDALAALPAITDLDLSNNLINDLPDAWQSDTLQTLDLNTCRISAIRNTTFSDFPELTRINMAGNRFTIPFRTDFFGDNTYLQEIWLGDNPWRCECRDTDFINFYQFLTEPPAKIWDKSQLRCISPESVYGKSWERACASVWYHDGRRMGTAETVWTFLMVGLIGSVCCVMSLRKWAEGRRLTEREEERARYFEEMRDIVRQNRARMDQEAQLNAPDPRETHPPCYEDALMLPRLDGSFASLDELTSRRAKRCNGSTTLPKDDSGETSFRNDDDDAAARRRRSRSEEVLSMRDAVETGSGQRRSRRAPRIVPVAVTVAETMADTVPVVARPDVVVEPELHYHTTDLSTLNHGLGLPGVSGASASPSAPLLPDSGKSNVIPDFNSRESSPYSKRRSRHLATFQSSSRDQLCLVDDHFGGGVVDTNTDTDTDTNDSDSFTRVNIDDMPQPSKI